MIKSINKLTDTVKPLKTRLKGGIMTKVKIIEIDNLSNKTVELEERNKKLEKQIQMNE